MATNFEYRSERAADRQVIIKYHAALQDTHIHVWMELTDNLHWTVEMEKIWKHTFQDALSYYQGAILLFVYKQL